MNIRKLRSTGKKTCLLIAGTLLLSACTLLEQELLSTSSMLESYSPSAYYNWAESATPEALEQERQRLEALHEAGSQLRSSVQYAVILSKTNGTDNLNTNEISSFLKVELNQHEGSENPQDAEYRTFGTIWQRQNELQILYEEAREASRLNAARIQELESEIRELRTTIRAFTSIERELSERGRNDENDL